jgi:signal transduction histidine kinase
VGQLAELELIVVGRGTTPTSEHDADSAGWRVALSWHLRQRDTVRALALADSVESGPLPLGAALAGRLLLVRAEVRWLQADIPSALRMAEQAEQVMASARECRGLSDVQVLLAMLAFDRGLATQAVRHLQQAEQLATDADDAVRASAAQAMQAYWSASGDIDEAEQRWGPLMQAFCTSPHMALSMWAHDYLTQVLRRRGRYAAAIANYDIVCRHALATGHIRRAIFACLNAATNHVTVNDFPGALDWVERGLALARPAGWPGNIGGCLALLGRVLTQLGRLEAARDALDEALKVLQPLAGSRTAVIPLFYASELAQTMGDHRRAVEGQQQVIADAEASGVPDLAQMGRLSLARALLALERPAQALATAEEALVLAQRDRSAGAEVGALLALADVHRSLPSPAAPSTSLPFLLRALEVAGTIQDFVVSPQHWDRLSAEYARCGDHAQAFAMASQASAARVQVQRKESNDRAIALAVRMDIDRSREESERLRVLAAQAAEKAALLQSNHDVLEQLGRMGQEITAQLDLDRVCERIQSHLRRLVDAPDVSIWLKEAMQPSLRLRFGAPGDGSVEGAEATCASDDSLVARCALGAQELLVEDAARLGALSRPPDGDRMQTALLGPMRVREACLGVVLIRSRRARAYGERERLIFRTLCAYSAIALDNAIAVLRLDHARQDLQQSAEAERRARRDAQHATQQRNHFLANVARRLESPLAQLHASLGALAASPDAAADEASGPLLAQALRQSQGVTALANELIELARLESAAVQPAPECFSIAELAQDVILACTPLALERRNGVVPEFASGALEVEADIAMIERVLTSLLRQALLRCSAGHVLRLGIWPEGDRVAVEFTVAAEALGDEVPSAEPLELSPDPFSLDLAISGQMLRLHGSELAIRNPSGGAWRARFDLDRGTA